MFILFTLLKDIRNSDNSDIVYLVEICVKQELEQPWMFTGVVMILCDIWEMLKVNTSATVTFEDSRNV
jgi:hypothetical protein